MTPATALQGAEVASYAPGGSVDADAETVRAGLAAAARGLEACGVRVPALGGKLIRPVVAYALVPPPLRPAVDERFWSGALAVEMAHEASLLHDDILDGAAERRGRPTEAASRGTAAALVLGDRYLTGAYRAAARTGAPTFLDAFIEAVERTVAGEMAQAGTAGRILTEAEYDGIVTGKSGELFGAAAALGGAVFGLGGHDSRLSLGRDLGALYQRVDDFLDCCPAARTGKPPLQDYRQRKWTWILGLAEVDSFELTGDELLRALLLGADGGASPARRALDALRARAREIVMRAQELAPGDELVGRVVDGWVAAATAALEAEESAHRGPPGQLPVRRESPEDEVRRHAQAVGGPEAWPGYFGAHAKTFRFAARLFPREQASLVSGVYAYCRFTDDLVDEPFDGADAEVVAARLEAWSHLTRVAFEGHATGVPLLDVVLGEAARRGVSWRYPDALLAGVGQDLARVRYTDWPELETYTFGVAGAVGGWITQLFGIHDERLLQRAHALGHGMQLTNIARDVGEDLTSGRLYLPLRLLHAHGLTEGELRRLAATVQPLPPGYRGMVEELLARAEAYYEEAWPGIRALPGWYRRPVAVAAEAYRGIHPEIRASGYDNLRRRASTGTAAKLLLAASGLARSRGRR